MSAGKKALKISVSSPGPSGSNGIPVMAFGVPPTSTVQPREVPNLGGFSFTTPGSVSTTSKSVINDISRVPNVTASIMSNSMQQTPTRSMGEYPTMFSMEQYSSFI